MRTTTKAGAALIAVAGSAAVASRTLFYFRDNFSTHYPIKTLAALAYNAHRIPWWNDAAGGGQPLAGNPNTLTFYPDNILYLIASPLIAFNLHFLLHVIVAFFAMRALVTVRGATRGTANAAAAMYAMSGIAISSLAFYNLVTAIALIPVAFYAAERLLHEGGIRPALLLGAAFGLLALAGEPVTVFAAAACVAALAARRFDARRVVMFLVAVAVSIVIAMPQIVAYSEIASEVERGGHVYSTRTVLAASLHPLRLAELAVGPFLGLLTDTQAAVRQGPLGDLAAADVTTRLFSTIFIGALVAPAVFRRARGVRYQVIVGLAAVLALGRFNPLVTFLVDRLPSLRVVRYPEKLVLPLVVALVVLVAEWLDSADARTLRRWAAIAVIPLALAVFGAFARSAIGHALLPLIAAAALATAFAYVVIRRATPRTALLALTFASLAIWAILAAPIDVVARYEAGLAGDVPQAIYNVNRPGAAPMRIFHEDTFRAISGETLDARSAYRLRAASLDPIFGAAARFQYAGDRSPDGMYSLFTRIVSERIAATPLPIRLRYLRIAGCNTYVSAVPQSDPGLGPPRVLSVGKGAIAVQRIIGSWPIVRVVHHAIAARTVQQAVQIIESPAFDEATVVAPARVASLPPLALSSFGASWSRPGSLTIKLDPAPAAPGLLFVNETYFSAWDARANGRSLDIVPLNLDRLGIVVPAGTTRIDLTFGRHRVLVAVAWAISMLLLVMVVGLLVLQNHDPHLRRVDDSLGA
ncbi:MAG TPA: hypothetical protein VEZ11_13340 [Thermoanaerobaculia bacterium]|nr:hypothetical protein [Thermoanaerobaculia bacterium]